jgi:hypothetical protein
MKALAFVLIALTGSFTTAKAGPNGCYTALDVENLRLSPATSLTDMRRCLSDFALPDSRDRIALKKAANAVAKACAKFLLREEEEDLHSSCYGIFNQNPSAMHAAWKRLKPSEQKVVQESYTEIANLNKAMQTEKPR